MAAATRAVVLLETVAASANGLTRRPYDEARYQAALRQAGSPVVALFDRVEPGKSPWKNPAKKTQKIR